MPLFTYRLFSLTVEDNLLGILEIRASGRYNTMGLIVCTRQFLQGHDFFIHRLQALGVVMGEGIEVHDHQFIRGLVKIIASKQDLFEVESGGAEEGKGRHWISETAEVKSIEWTSADLTLMFQTEITS